MTTTPATTTTETTTAAPVTISQAQKRQTLQARVAWGDHVVTVGGDAPVRVQSMTNTDTADAVATAIQVKELAQAGSELVRITVNNDESAKAVPYIREQLDRMGIMTPLVGDFHYNGHRLLADHPDCAQALSKYRINPGNVGRGEKGDKQFAQMIDPAKVKVVVKSVPIPYPPIAVHPKVSNAIKAKLRDAFNNVDKLPGVTKDQIRGYGGGKVDGYTAKVSEQDMANAGKMFDQVTDQVKTDIMKKASAR